MKPGPKRTPRGTPANLITVWKLANRWDFQEGHAYYLRQRNEMLRRALDFHMQFSLIQVSAAFAALSPNNAESTNYRALDICMGIAAGQLDEFTKVPAYGGNRKKALAILRGEPIDKHLRGQKVRSFHANTLDPQSSREVTVDGHMLGAWVGHRLLLRREAEIKHWEYPVIRQHFIEAAESVNTHVTSFQAVLWLTWKRIHGILRPPQTTLDFITSLKIT